MHFSWLYLGGLRVTVLEQRGTVDNIGESVVADFHVFGGAGYPLRFQFEDVGEPERWV